MVHENNAFITFLSSSTTTNMKKKKRAMRKSSEMPSFTSPINPRQISTLSVLFIVILTLTQSSIQISNGNFNHNTIDYIRQKNVKLSNKKPNLLDEIRSEIKTTTMKDKYKNGKTLALLYPFGLIGGYRNQVLRFVAFVEHAKKHNISQMLLPSMIWSTQYKIAPAYGSTPIFYPIPMDFLFDIDHWNSFSDHLPIFVNEIDNSDCWQPNQNVTTDLPIQLFDFSITSSKFNDLSDKTNISNVTGHVTKPKYWVSPMAPTVLERGGFLTPVANVSRSIIQGHQIVKRPWKDYLPAVQNCTHPIVIGGGRAAGRLWNSYLALTRPPNRQAENQTHQFLKHITNALRPSLYWRELANQCVTHYQDQQKLQQQQQDEKQYDVQHHVSTMESDEKSTTRASNFVALHARVEVEMMRHKCGRDMEMNLTKIFGMVDSFVREYNKKQNLQKENLNGVFVAVARQLINDPVNSLAKENWKAFMSHIADGNVSIANNTSGNSNRFENVTNSASSTRQYFECGEHWMDRWYDDMTTKYNRNIDNKNNQKKSFVYDHFGDIVPSMINFHIATQASIFIGVSKSSWSAAVWQQRYYEGKGSRNYEYTKNGIVQLPNDRPPTLHKNC